MQNRQRIRGLNPRESGNPAGRPLGSKNKPKVLNDLLLTDLMREEYSRHVEIKDGDEVKHDAIIRSIVRKRYAAADAGDEKAQLWAIASVREVEAADAKRQEAEFVYAENYKKRFQGVTLGSLSGGNASKSPIPNPNHIVINDLDRTVAINGPKNVEEHIDWLELLDRRIEESVTREFDQQVEADKEENFAPSPDAEDVDANPGTIKDAVPGSENNSRRPDLNEQGELKPDAGEQGEVRDAEQLRQADLGEHEEVKDADESSVMMPRLDPYYEDRVRNRPH